MLQRCKGLGELVVTLKVISPMLQRKGGGNSKRNSKKKED